MEFGEHGVAGQVQATNLDPERATPPHGGFDLPLGVGPFGEPDHGEMDAVGRVEVVLWLDAAQLGRGLPESLGDVGGQPNDSGKEPLSFDGAEMSAVRALREAAHEQPVGGERDAGGGHQRASWCSMTPSPRSSSSPPGRVPLKLPKGCLYA
jgi:hypothetical protein